jgi:hypothetical protein
VIFRVSFSKTWSTQRFGVPGDVEDPVSPATCIISSTTRGRTGGSGRQSDTASPNVLGHQNARWDEQSRAGRDEQARA